MKKSLFARYQALGKRLRFKNHAPSLTHQKRIIIFIHQAQPLDASWVILTEHSEIQQTVLHGDLTALTPMANQHQIHVIIPGHDVLLTQAELPKLSRERLQQALPYAVEEKLIDDITLLHFAPGKHTTHGIPVAIISKEKMNYYLDTLKQSGISPYTMIPATLALPWTTHHWYASCDDHISTVRTNAFSGFACDRSNLQTLLHLQALETPVKPECIHLDNYSSTPLSLELDPILLNETTLTENHFLEKIAILLGANPYINLLQGAYRPKRKTTQAKKMWYIAGAFAAAWFTLSITGNIVSYVMLSHEKTLSEHAIQQIYRQQFPTATSIVAPRERMESALKQAAATANKNYFLTLLGMIGDAIAKSPDIQLKDLSYQEDRMALNIKAASFNQLDSFTQHLSDEGLKVKQQNAASTDTQVKADILITKGDL